MKQIERIARAIVTSMLCFMLCLGTAYVLPPQSIVQAETLRAQAIIPTTTRNLKKAGLKLDLKKNKAVKVPMYSRGGSISYSAKISNLKISKIGSNRKKATFTVTTKLRGITRSQRYAIIKSIKQGYSDYAIFGNIYCVLCDYNSGLVLNKANKCKVRKTVNSYKETFTKAYYSTDISQGFRLQKTCTAKVTVTFPANYSGLCVGVGGSAAPRSKANKAQNSYAKGKTVSFYKTTMYLKSKKSFHFMRIK